MSNSNPLFNFQTVKREKIKASIVIEGLSGKGKSGLALVLAQALAGNFDKVYAIDTENRSLNLYAGLPSSNGGKFDGFHVASFTSDLGYKPSFYLDFRDAAVDAGAEVVIFDSISHAWQYKGGVLDMVSELKKTNPRYQRDGYAAWGDDSVVKEKNILLDMLRDHRCHMISTVRVKEKMEYGEGADGKKALLSLGEQQIMQGDMKFEPDLVLQMVEPGVSNSKHVRYPKAKVIKSRYATFEVDAIVEFTPETCNNLRKYLEEGTSPEEIMESQRVEYVTSIAKFLDGHPDDLQIWKSLKTKAGYEKVDLEKMPLEAMRTLFMQLTAKYN